MLVIVEANGDEIRVNITVSDFQQLIAEASPSPWVAIDVESLGQVQLNVFTIAYFYEE